MANLKPGGEKAALCLEDLRVGQRFLSGTHRIDEEQIRAFAEQFDPQPFHLDAEAAATSRERNCSWTAASLRCITLAPKKLIRTRRASEGSASEPSPARRVSMR